MEITDVRVYPARDEKVRAFVSIVFDRCFMVNDIKVIQGKDGLFVSMPSRKRKSGEFKDVAHPLNSETRKWVEERILGVYQANLDGTVCEGASISSPLSPEAGTRPGRRRDSLNWGRESARGRSKRSSGCSSETLSGKCPEQGDRVAGKRGRHADRGASPSGKARDFGSRIRRFESSRPNQIWPCRTRGRAWQSAVPR